MTLVRIVNPCAPSRYGFPLPQLRLARQRFVHGHTTMETFDDEDGVNETLAQVRDRSVVNVEHRSKAIVRHN